MLKDKRRIRWVGGVAGLLVLVILINLTMNNTALAERVEEYDLKYNETATAGWQGFYSSNSSLDASYTILAISNMKIKSVQLMRDGKAYEQVSEPIGKESASETVKTTGQAYAVKSENNTGAKTYFAWYRFSSSSPDKRWYADHEDDSGNPEKILSGSDQTESIGGVRMPKYPGTSAKVTFGAKRSKSYKMDDETEMSPSLVKVTGFTNVSVIEGAEVTGPEGTYGKSEGTDTPNPISGAYLERISETDSENFNIKYWQSFNKYPNGEEPAESNPAIKILGAPGARLMVYFGSFTFDIEGETYKHPDKIQVTYEPKGGNTSSPTPSSSGGGGSSSPAPATPTPDIEKIIAMFEIEKPVIELGEQNSAKPTGSSVSGGGQSLKDYVWTVSQGSNTMTKAGNALLTMGGFPPTPGWLTTGTVSVSLKVVSTSGKSATAGPKTFEVIRPASCAAPNSPSFKIGFVDHGNRGAFEEITTATVGEYLDVQVLAPRPDETPPSGSSARTVISWDWEKAIKSSGWLKQFYEYYQPSGDEEYYSFPYSMVLKDTDLGTHSITAVRTDACGDRKSSTAMVTVQPPNPIAVIRGQAIVKEARPLTQPFDSSGSYSPVRNRAIDHSRDEWTNKKDVYYTPGTEIITLKVWDQAGLPSLNVATHKLTVMPDEPPVALGKAPAKAIRGTSIIIKNASYSPDGDPLKLTELWEQYDSNNDGNFDEETLVPLSFGADGTVNRTFSRVGKYRYKIRTVEDSPLKKEDTSYFYLDVVNDSPWVSFEMSSLVQEPMVIPKVPVSLDPAQWAATSAFDEQVKKNWRMNDDGSTGTYPYFSTMNYSSFVSDPSTASYRTADPYRSEVIRKDYFNQEISEDGSSFYSINRFYVGGLGTIWNHHDYKSYYGTKSTIWLETFTGKKAVMFNGATASIHSINVYADEITIRTWALSSGTTGSNYPYYFVYRLSSLFNNWEFSPTPEDPNRYTVKMISPLRSYNNNEVVEKTGFWDYHYAPARITASNLGEGVKLSQWVKQDDAKIDTPVRNAGPSADGGMLQIDNFGRAEKLNKYEQTMWRVQYSDTEEFRTRHIFYNLDETRAYLIGQMYYWEKDSDDEWGYNAGKDFIKVVRTQDGSVVNTIQMPVSSPNMHIYPYDYTSVYMGKLIILSSTGLYVYDDALNLLKYDPTVTSGRITGDGFIVNSSIGTGDASEQNSFTLYDLRTYQYSMSGQNVGKLPMEMFYDEELNGGISRHDIGSLASGPTVVHAAVKNVPIQDRPLLSHSQLLSDHVPSMKDFNITFTYKYMDPNYTGYNTSGMAFKVQDRKNMYRLEFNASKVMIVRMVDGKKTILKSQNYTFDQGVYYSFRIRSNANKHTVYVNGVPQFEVTDDFFQEGRFGPSTDLFNVSFKDLFYQDMSGANGSSLVKDTVLVDQEIQYALTYEDTENDPHPLELTWWKFEQTNPNKFLDAGDGKSGWSGMNGRTDHGNLPSLDKVGVWRVTHWLKDDPHPEYPYPSEVFGTYRGESNQYGRNIIVHRRPMAQFTLWLNGDGTIGWNDTSYDPDRWLSAWNYSTESSAYASNRGIYSRKYKYTTPSGMEIEGKLTRPSEAGVYTVSLAVMDEYGAWSDWYDQTIQATTPLSPNKPPVVDFESPTSVYRDDLIQLVNKSYDPDGDPMTYKWTIMKPPYLSQLSTAKDPAFIIRERGLGKDAVSPNWFIELTATDSKGESGMKTRPLEVLNHRPTTSITGQQEVLIRQTHSYQSGGTDLDSEDNGNLSYSWKVTAPDGTETSYSISTISLTFSQGGTYKLEHWVTDPVGDSSNVAQLLVNVDDNKPPIPGFTMLPNPAYRGETVEIVSTASDPDGIIAKHEYTITRPNGEKLSWTTKADWSHAFDALGDYTIHQRVEDNKGASAEMSQVLHVMNRPPMVELTTPSGPDKEHPSVNIPPFRAEWSYQDEDGDPQASYHFRITNSATEQLVLEGQETNSRSYWDVPAGVLKGGVVYEARVSVSDGIDTAESTPKYFVLNRPPVADFDWTPKPVWEGDRVRIVSTSTDPDGDTLTYEWTVGGPDGRVWNGSTGKWERLSANGQTPGPGSKVSGTEAEWNGVFSEPGSYRVKLKVSDGYEEDEAEKVIEVQPLSIDADVLHTSLWLEHHTKQGHETTTAPKDFYSGEKLMLELFSSPAPVEKAEAWLEAKGMDGRTIRLEEQLNAAASSGQQEKPKYEGELYDEVLSSLTKRLPNGEYEVHFRLTYTNGTVKLQDVPIRIIGSVKQAVQVHRVQ